MEINPEINTKKTIKNIDISKDFNEIKKINNSLKKFNLGGMEILNIKKININHELRLEILNKLFNFFIIRDE
jgi:hypothetical protein